MICLLPHPSVPPPRNFNIFPMIFNMFKQFSIWLCGDCINFSVWTISSMVWTNLGTGVARFLLFFPRVWSPLHLLVCFGDLSRLLPLRGWRWGARGALPSALRPHHAGLLLPLWSLFPFLSFLPRCVWCVCVWCYGSSKCGSAGIRKWYIDSEPWPTEKIAKAK